MGYGLIGMVMAMMMTGLLLAGGDAAQSGLRLLSAGILIGVVVGLGAMLVSTVKKLRAEQAMVEAAGELVQLRRWPQAGLVLEQILSSPSPTHGLRSQALVYLAAVLSRYHRFDDAIAVHNHLLEHDLLDPGTAFGVRLSRTMAMLREDHLFDADRAISELRRLERDETSAGLALIEIYRDVKTGHPDEAIELFESSLPTLRDQLGHRVADVYALAARAYDLRERKSEAQDAWMKATLLAPPGELLRRYPEIQAVADNYRSSPAPADAVG